MDNQLPADVLVKIQNDALAFSNKSCENEEITRFIYTEAATEYATKLHAARTLLEKLVSNKHVFILPEQIEIEIKKFLDGK